MRALEVVAPAPAGMLPPGPPLEGPVRRRPRSRGGAPLINVASMIVVVSPPRLRGCSVQRMREQWEREVAPAPAGMLRRTSGSSAVRCRRPRARGDAPSVRPRTGVHVGSPRARGDAPPPLYGLTQQWKSPPRPRGCSASIMYWTGVRTVTPRPRGCSGEYRTYTVQTGIAPAPTGMILSRPAYRAVSPSRPRARADAPSTWVRAWGMGRSPPPRPAGMVFWVRLASTSMPSPPHPRRWSLWDEIQGCVVEDAPRRWVTRLPRPGATRANCWRSVSYCWPAQLRACS